MATLIGSGFKRRFGTRVLLPGALILLFTGALCAAGLLFAGKSSDTMTLFGQQIEVWQASSHGMDELSVAQESVGLCDDCIRKAAADHPDRTWIDNNIAFRMFDLYNTQETYLVDRKGQPVYAAIERKDAPLSAYDRVRPEVDRFVKLARGQMKRPSGRSNLNERLPGSPPAPLVFPPVPGFSDQPTTVYPSVRTTPSVLHATDLVRIGDRIALISVMQMTRVTPAHPRGDITAPVLINLRYLDASFLKEVARQYYLVDPRIAASPAPHPGETSTSQLNSDGVPLSTIFLKQMLPGNHVFRSLLISAGCMFAVISLLISLMSLKLRRAMQQE